ncbi:MAG: hypothetical protein FWG27_07335 [Treponema sp.]|nr:hypothetical protein [Treponema sp.]
MNTHEAAKIDPQPDRYLDSRPKTTAELYPGEYFFTQIRRELKEDSELLEIAMELQKEGLWRRFKLENKFYVRSLFEDGSPVSQLWRPLIVPHYSIGFP